MNILIVEDELKLAEEIKNYLSDFKYVCSCVPLFSKALESINSQEFAIALVDINLPDGNGIEIIKYIKSKKLAAGIIVMSAVSELDIKINALEAGADDYLIKPFHLSELNARIKALIRRNQYQGNNIIEYKEISIDIPKLQVSINGNVISLTNKEYELLLYFIANAGKVITKEAIGYSVWSNHSDMDVSNDIIYTHIKNLRKKLVASGCEDYVKSVYGIGYKFDT